MPAGRHPLTLASSHKRGRAFALAEPRQAPATISASGKQRPERPALEGSENTS